jgi:hypothetical protein
MATTVRGIVKDGLIVPNVPLPDGTRVEIRVLETPPAVPPELEAEFEAWDRASANALELVERLAQEDPRDEQR